MLKERLGSLEPGTLRFTAQGPLPSARAVRNDAWSVREEYHLGLVISV